MKNKKIQKNSIENNLEKFKSTINFVYICGCINNEK